jgi:hypothetical protein
MARLRRNWRSASLFEKWDLLMVQDGRRRAVWESCSPPSVPVAICSEQADSKLPSPTMCPSGTFNFRGQ